MVWNHLVTVRPLFYITRSKASLFTAQLTRSEEFGQNDVSWTAFPSKSPMQAIVDRQISGSRNVQL
jgi:hypothetical protein